MDQTNVEFYVRNYDKLCKFCCKLKSEEDEMKFILNKGASAESTDLIEKITYTLNSESLVDETEYHYINLICNSCEDKINNFFSFKKNCELNSLILYQVVSELEKKVHETTPKVPHIESKPNDLQENTKSKHICTVCGKFVKGIGNHMLIHRAAKNFKCQYCPKSFTQSGQLKRHINSHLNIRNYSCPQCDRTFVDSSSVTKHLVIHNKDEKKFVCSLCGKKFNRLGTLRYHEKTHRQERKHKCSLCEKSFLAKYDLTKHFRVHTGEKPYSCPICGKKFSISKNAKVHMKVHSKEKPFSCNLCQLRFSYRSTLKQHINKMHNATPSDGKIESSCSIDINELDRIS